MSPDFTSGALVRPIPVVPGWDQSLRFLADPYRFIVRECRRQGSDVVQARLMLQTTLCLTGPRAAELFYDKTRFRRFGGAPEPVRATLFGKGAVQTLDGAEHLLRKQFFMATCGPGPTAELVARATEEWERLVPRWRAESRLELYGAAQEWLARSACRWAGVPLPEAEVGRRTAQLAALFDSAASGVAAHLRARRARWEAEAWLARLLHNHRSGGEPLPTGSPAAAAAELADSHGRPLPARTAAVELLNVLRPIVAVSVFIVLAAHALHLHPAWRDTLAAGHDSHLEAFVQEVRRYYPFFPAVAAQVCRDFVWNGWHFPQGARAMLDLYGTNHDARAWPEPNQFRPERFFGAIPGLFDFVPHGGGRAEDHHRCPGEGITVALMKLALRQLTGHLHYSVPPQDLRIQIDRLPALPFDRFVIQGLVAA